MGSGARARIKGEPKVGARLGLYDCVNVQDKPDWKPEEHPSSHGPTKALGRP